MVESLFGIVQPFRKLVTLLSIMMVGLTTAWSFEFATVALNASEAHYLQVVGIIVAIQGLVTYLMKETFNMYWRGRQ
jgi:hypothetical protein